MGAPLGQIAIPRNLPASWADPDQVKQFFNPNQDMLAAQPDQQSQQPGAPGSIAAGMQPSDAPGQNNWTGQHSERPLQQPMQSSAAALAPAQQTPAPAAADATAQAPSGPMSSADFFKANPDAWKGFEPARPVGALDDVHGIRKALALAFGGMASMGAGMNHQQDPTLRNWTDQQLAERQYDANLPHLQAEGQNKAFEEYQKTAGSTANIEHTQAETGLTQQQIENLKLNPPGKADFLKELQTRRASGADDPDQLAQEYFVRAPYSHVSRQEVMSVINSTPEQAPQAKIGPQGIAEPLKYRGRTWNGTEPDAPAVVKAAFAAAKPVEDTIHKNKLQEQEAGRQKVVLQNNLANGPLANGPSVPVGVTGAAALDHLDPHVAALVQMIGDGKIDFATATSRMQPTAKANLATAVHTYNPEFDQSTYGIRKQVGETFTSGDYSKQLNAISTAREHMKTFGQLADALNNGDTQALNRIGNAIGVQFGSDKATNMRIAAQAFGGEVGRAFDGAGVTEGERKQAQQAYSDAMSKGQFHGAIETVDQLLAGKQNALQQTYDQGRQGKPNFGNANEQQGQQQKSAPEGTVVQVGNKHMVKRNGQWVAQ